MSCLSTERVTAGPGVSAVDGRVEWAPMKSLWTGGMTLAALALGPFYVTPGAVALFLGTSAATLCLGHSIGLHRLLIHRSFETPLWLEHALAWLGTLVGMAEWCGCMICGIGRSVSRPAIPCTLTRRRPGKTLGGKCTAV